jgi:hypothetical protein
MRDITSETTELVQIEKRSTAILAVLAAIAFAFVTAPAYSQAVLMSGFAEQADLSDGGVSNGMVLPHGKSAADMVGVGVDRNNRGYFWWGDGTVTQGTGYSAYDYASARRFDLPFGKHADDIVAMAIDESGRVYTYYDDFTVSIGDPFELDAIDRPRPYVLRAGYMPRNIIDAGILDGDVILFFNDGTHHYTDIDNYRNFTRTAPDYDQGQFRLPPGYGMKDVVGMDFADKDGKLYTVFASTQQFDTPTHANVSSYAASAHQPGFTSQHSRVTTFTAITPAHHTNTFGRTTHTFGETGSVIHSHSTRREGITVAKDGISVTLPIR